MPRPLGTVLGAADGHADVVDEVRDDEQAAVQPTLVVSRQPLVADPARPEDTGSPTDTAASHAGVSDSAAPAATLSTRSTPLVGPNSTTMYDPNPRVAQPWHSVAEPRAMPSFNNAAESLRPVRHYDAPPRARPQAPTRVPWHVAATWGDTTLHIESNTAAGASYIFWWISGLLVYFNERNNRYVRFHAMQSILLSGAMTVLAVLTSILAALCWDVAARTQLRVLYALGNGIAVLAVVALLMVWIGTMVAAWTGHLIRLPIIGGYAERYAAPAMQVSPPLDD